MRSQFIGLQRIAKMQLFVSLLILQTPKAVFLFRSDDQINALHAFFKGQGKRTTVIQSGKKTAPR